MGLCGIASITRGPRPRKHTVSSLTLADRISLPSLVWLVSLVVVVILARLVCIIRPPIQPMNRSRSEHTSLSRSAGPSTQTSKPRRPTHRNPPILPIRDGQ